MLRVIRETVVSASVVFVDEEDERLAAAALSAIRRQVLSKADVTQWISGFASAAWPPTSPEWYRTRTNIKHFLRSLYFRSLYQGVIELTEPALSQTLREIGDRRRIVTTPASAG